MRKLLVLAAIVAGMAVLNGCASEEAPSGTPPAAGASNPGATVQSTTGGGGENAVTPTDK